MDSFEINKILGALLFTCLVVLSLNITANAIFAPVKPEKQGYVIAVKATEGDQKQTATAPAADEKPLPVRLASANVEKGQADAKKCATCHTFNKGGPNQVGPNLWGIVGREHASLAGFSYSDAMKKLGGQWTLEQLDQFLANPKGMVPGTKMSFAGLTRATERADVIAYLNSLADNPQPLPTAQAAPAAAPDGAAAPAAPAAPPAEAPKANAPSN